MLHKFGDSVQLLLKTFVKRILEERLVQERVSRPRPISQAHTIVSIVLAQCGLAHQKLVRRTKRGQKESRQEDRKEGDQEVGQEEDRQEEVTCGRGRPGC